MITRSGLSHGEIVYDVCLPASPNCASHQVNCCCSCPFVQWNPPSPSPQTGAGQGAACTPQHSCSFAQAAKPCSCSSSVDALLLQPISIMQMFSNSSSTGRNENIRLSNLVKPLQRRQLSFKCIAHQTSQCTGPHAVGAAAWAMLMMQGRWSPEDDQRTGRAADSCPDIAL